MTEREPSYDDKAAESQGAPDEGAGWDGETEPSGEDQSERAEK